MMPKKLKMKPLMLLASLLLMQGHAFLSFRF